MFPFKDTEIRNSIMNTVQNVNTTTGRFLTAFS